MKEETIKELIEMLLNHLPNEKNVSGKKLIIAFEKMRENLPKGVSLLDLANPVYNSQNSIFDQMNRFFRTVHSAIRAKSFKKNSLIDKALEEVLLFNFRESSKIAFTKEQGIEALNIVLDWYDPNKNQGFERQLFNWEGFTSIITTKDGLISEVSLLEQLNREMFYDALESITEIAPPKEEFQTPSKKQTQKTKIFINQKRN